MAPVPPLKEPSHTDSTPSSSLESCLLSTTNNGKMLHCLLTVKRGGSPSIVCGMSPSLSLHFPCRDSRITGQCRPHTARSWESWDDPDSTALELRISAVLPAAQSRKDVTSVFCVLAVTSLDIELSP